MPDLYTHGGIARKKNQPCRRDRAEKQKLHYKIYLLLKKVYLKIKKNICTSTLKILKTIVATLGGHVPLTWEAHIEHRPRQGSSLAAKDSWQRCSPAPPPLQSRCCVIAHRTIMRSNNAGQKPAHRCAARLDGRGTKARTRLLGSSPVDYKYTWTSHLSQLQCIKSPVF